MKKLFALLIAVLLAFAPIVSALAEDEGTELDFSNAPDAAAEAYETGEEVVEELEPADEESEPEPRADDAEPEAEASDFEEVKPGLLQSVFGKLTEQKWYVWALIALLLAAGIILRRAAATKWASRRVAYAAMCIAIAFVLSCIRLYRMPQGGSVTPASMLPLVIFMVACGPVQGFAVGFAFGLLELIADPWIVHPIQVLVDYPLAFGVMAIGCLATVLPLKRNAILPVAVLIAGIGRYAMAVLSGTVFFAEYAGDQNALVYSLVYNISYLGPDLLVCVAIACIPGMPRLIDMVRGGKSIY